MWDVERLRRAKDHADERALFEAKRRQNMDERQARARLHRPTGNVIPLGSRARVYEWPPDEAA